MLLAAGAARGQNGTSEPGSATEPFGIALEGFPYPYSVHLFPLTQEGEQLRMAYMDVAPKGDATGRTVLLLHGRNFPSSYWHSAIAALTGWLWRRHASVAAVPSASKAGYGDVLSKISTLSPSGVKAFAVPGN